MNKKILYISELNPKLKSGGSASAKRDLAILEKEYDVESTGVYTKDRTTFGKIFDLFTSPNPILYSIKDIKKLKRIIKNSDAEIVFLCSSLLGNFAKFCKKNHKKVITYFQNCELELFKSCRSFVWQYHCKKLEKACLKYSNSILILNQRDLDALKKNYKYQKNNYTFYPVSLQDFFPKEYQESDEKYGLFLGAYFAPNVEAVSYISKKLSKELSVKIKVVGYELEKIKELETDKVEILGTVEDLTPYLINADFMIFPIFSGGGMKVKTCQAMMFGKTIFGTKEAFEGYKINPEFMKECNTANEFVESINSYMAEPHKKFNLEVRSLWLENYSMEAAKKILTAEIEKMN